MNSTDTLEPGKTDQKPNPASTLLRDAIKAARAAQAEQGDSLSEARREDISKLELLEERLKSLIAEIPSDNRQFDLNIARSNPARFWIDVVAYVSVNRDRSTYEFIKETRAGRRRIVESGDVGVLADAIRDYIAERIVERERALAGDILDMPSAMPQQAQAAAVETKLPPVRRGFSGTAILLAFLLGALAGAAGLLTYSYVTVASLPVAN